MEDWGFTRSSGKGTACEFRTQPGQTSNSRLEVRVPWVPPWYSKTPCAMIQTSAWQRLCVYSPEVTGSCLLTSVASTMEPRKVRKLKILTGFRPVSDPLPRCLRNLARPCKKKGPKEKHKGRKKERKTGLQKPECRVRCQSQWSQTK